MTKSQVLFIGDLNKSLPEYKAFEENFDCIHYNLPSVEQLIEDFNTKFANVEAIYGAWLGFAKLGGFKNKILEHAPKNLKIVAICSVGYNGYDGDAMKRRGIILTNVPSVGAAEPVADTVLYLAINSFRNFNLNTSNFSQDLNDTVAVRCALDSDGFDSERGKVVAGDHQGYSFGQAVGGRPCLSPRGNKATILGFGMIGRKIGERLSSIGMEIHYVKRKKLSESEEVDLGYKATFHSSIEEASQFTDLIVIALPGTPETHHLINAKVIESMPKPFRIINVGRGTIIDEQALVNGLKSGKILFAGLDVYENEPRVHSELFSRQDVVLLPHVGASTLENFNYTSIVAMKNIENVLLHKGGGFDRVN